MTLIGWLANVCLIVSFWYMNHQQRVAFLWSMAGNLLWLHEGLQLNRYDLVFVCVVFVGLACDGWYRWGKKEEMNVEKAQEMAVAKDPQLPDPAGDRPDRVPERS